MRRSLVLAAFAAVGMLLVLSDSTTAVVTDSRIPDQLYPDRTYPWGTNESDPSDLKDSDGSLLLGQECLTLSDNNRCYAFESRNATGNYTFAILGNWFTLPGNYTEWTLRLECFWITEGDPSDAENLTLEIYGYNMTSTYTDLCPDVSVAGETVFSHPLTLDEWQGPYGPGFPGGINFRLFDGHNVTDYLHSHWRIDQLVLERTATVLPPPANPLSDTAIMLLLLILWIAFGAFGALAPSGLLSLLAALCGVLLSFYYLLPTDTVAGVAVMGLAIVHLVAGIGIGIAEGR